MRRLTRYGLIGLCAGMLGIPALADGPDQVRVGVVDAKGQLAAPIGLTYEIDGQLYKAQFGPQGILFLDTYGAERITLGIDGQPPLELTLTEANTNLLLNPQEGTHKFVSQGGFDQTLRVAGSNHPPVGHADAITDSVMSAPAAARLSSMALASGLRQGSDDCAGAEAIAGEGTFDFDNSAATSVGPNHPACLEFGFDSITFDVWFCWTAPADGTFTVETCDVSSIDTKIAVYDGCSCDGVGDATLLGCNDDTCSLQSSVEFTAVSGQSYLIRVGMYPGSSAGGTGQFTISGSGPPPTGGGEDDCADAEAISGTGNFSFDNTGATAVGPNHPECLEFGFDGIGFDVWFCWTAPADGDYALETCDLTTLDTKVAVYDGCSCAALESTLLGCNDDTCSLQSTVNFSAVGGQSYLIRVGTYPGVTAGGFGEFSINEAGPPPVPADCNQPLENCQVQDPADALNATAGVFNTADDFVVTADGSITGLCWFGAYFDGFGDCQAFVSDDFTVTYYANDGGFPGAAIASFSQSGGTLTVAGPSTTGGTIAGFLPEYLFSAEHAPVAVTADTCYWLEISNAITGCSFFWEIAAAGEGNGRILQDGNPPNGYDLTDAAVNDAAFCLDLELGDPNCAPAPLETPCEQPDANCQLGDQINAFNSTPSIFTVADDFETPSSRATVTSVCWTGGAQDGSGLPCGGPGGDNFTITYYDDAGGMPGAVLGSFSQSGGTLTVDQGPTGLLIAGALAEIEYTGDHAPLSLGDGTCYWVEITNDAGAGCNWFWGTSLDGNGFSFQDGDGFVAPDGYTEADRVAGDLSFCLDSGLGDAGNCLPEGPANDDCANAEMLACDSSVTVDNTFATDDPTDPPFSCRFNGSANGAGSVWYTFMATDTSAFLDTNASGGGDTLIAVYSGTCGSLTELACSEDEGDGLLSQLCVEGLTVGETYYVQLAAFDAASQGVYTLSIECPCPAPPEPPVNDDCEDAIMVAVGSTTAGDTTLATIDTTLTCGTTVTTAGVWYTVIGTGNTMTASLCNGATGYDSKIGVYCGDCDALTCVDGNDDSCGLQSEISWCSQAGATYRILVHGFGGAVGSFELTVTDDGVACDADVQCLPAGACCLMDGSCVITTADDCATQGGSFQGEGTDCGGLAYTLTTCTNLFEDISESGAIAALASSSDDNGDANVPIGFDFTFFGSTYSTVGIASNGYLTFGEDLSDLSNDPIPTATLPNDLIAVLWDDLNPSGPNSVVYYETRGTAPNRMLIVQWDNVPQFANTDDNTFQAILHEGSNAIEMRYKSITPEAFAGDYTVGIENADGSFGLSADASTLGAGSCIRFEAVVTPSPCVEVIEFDLLPGDCPNVLRRPLGGLPRIIPGALLGSADFDVTEIDVSAGITVERVDGVGFATGIFSSSMDDVGTPFADNGCDCHDLNGDGFMDLVINFDRNPFRNAIDITSVPLGDEIPLVVRGTLTSGVPFAAYDCLQRTQPGFPTDAAPIGLRSNNPGATFEVTPADLYENGGEALPVDLSYDPGTIVTVAAPLWVDGQRFHGWKLNGELVSNAIEFTVVLYEDTILRAIYRNRTVDVIGGDAELLDVEVEGMEFRQP